MTKQMHTDLQWLAFCYAAGELSASQVEEFEERLAHDQQAREAVAQVVVLWDAAQVVRVVAPAPMPAPVAEPGVSGVARRRRWEVAAGWAAVALAVACAVLAVQWRDDTEMQLADAGRLVDLWAHEEFASEMLPASLAHLPTEAVLGDTFDAVERPHDDEAVFAVPDWMLAAVSVETGGTAADAPALREEEN